MSEHACWCLHPCSCLSSVTGWHVRPDSPCQARLVRAQSELQAEADMGSRSKDPLPSSGHTYPGSVVHAGSAKPGSDKKRKKRSRDDKASPALLSLHAQALSAVPCM